MILNEISIYIFDYDIKIDHIKSFNIGSIHDSWIY